MLTLPTLVYESDILLTYSSGKSKKKNCWTIDACLNLSEQLYMDVILYYPDMSLRSIFLLPKKKIPMPVQKLIGE